MMTFKQYIEEKRRKKKRGKRKHRTGYFGGLPYVYPAYGIYGSMLGTDSGSGGISGGGE